MHIMVLLVFFTGLPWASVSSHRGCAKLATVLSVCWLFFESVLLEPVAIITAGI